MKNTFIIGTLLFAFSFIDNNVQAQAFQKGNINVDIGMGFGVYGTSQKSTVVLNGLPITTSESDGAVSTMIPIRFEYGLLDRLGIGAEFISNNYLINDSDRVNLNSVKSLDYGLNVNFHLLKAEKNDLFVGLGVGMSSMNIDYNTSSTQFVESVSGSGIYYTLGIADRIFFSDHIGMMVSLSYRGYNYTNLESDFSSELDSQLALYGVTYSQNWDWKFNGVNLGVGLALKF